MWRAMVNTQTDSIFYINRTIDIISNEITWYFGVYMNWDSCGEEN